MKKYTILFWTLVLLVVAATSVISCDNGIGDNLDALTARLTELNSELAAATSDIQVSVYQITEDIEAALATAQASQEDLEDAISIIDQINEELDELLLAMQSAATTEELLQILADVEKLQAAIEYIEDYGDLDYDGIRNAVDKCPGTDPGVKVDINGCPITG
jgi:tetratricopeptide (TPR) repeat protein